MCFLTVCCRDLLLYRYDSEGKDTSLAAIGSGMSPSNMNGARSMYSDRVSLSHITSNPSLGEDKVYIWYLNTFILIDHLILTLTRYISSLQPVFFSIKAYVSYIKPDQAMWYRACKTCNKKVTEAMGSGYWCENCQKNEDDCSLRYINWKHFNLLSYSCQIHIHKYTNINSFVYCRYIMVVKVSDASGEAFLSVFNEQAEKIVGHSADELNEIKSQVSNQEKHSYISNAWCSKC